MRIVLFHNLPSGGAKRHTLEQVRELVARGHQIVEYAPETADLEFCNLAPYVMEQRIFASPRQVPLAPRLPLATPYIHAAQGLMILRQTRQLNESIAAIIDAENFDLAFVKDCHIVMNPYILSYLETKSVFQCHHAGHRFPPSNGGAAANLSLISRLKNVYYRPAKSIFERKFLSDERRNIRAASVVLTNSQFSKKLIGNHFGVHSNVIYPGINTEIFRPKRVAKQNIVICVGGLVFGKGYRFLVSAISHIAAHRRPQLLIVANTKDKEEEAIVQNLAKKLGVSLNIERITDDAKLVEAYNRAKVFVYAPLQEALGMAPLEAMACGTPVVAVAEGGVTETVVHGVTGWLTRREEEEYAQRLDALLQDDDIRKRMGELAVEYVRKNWNWNVAVDNLESELSGARGSYA